jgi:hypothetical protein
MTDTTEISIQVPLSEARRIFDLLEKIHHLMHQPMYYKDPMMVEKFADDNYVEIKHLYYKIVWNWLPVDVQREIEER